jgi:hypothetical protein
MMKGGFLALCAMAGAFVTKAFVFEHRNVNATVYTLDNVTGVGQPLTFPVATGCANGRCNCRYSD